MTTENQNLPVEETEEELAYAKARRAKSKARRAGREEQAIGLNINSMMDMMTIILCFLLKSYGSEPITVNENEDLRLTFSTTTIGVEDMLVITVTKREIIVGEQPASVEIRGGAIDASQVQASTNVITRMEEAVRLELEREAAVSAALGREEQKVVTIVADLDTQFQILAQVMVTLAAAGVTEVKFGVLRCPQGQSCNDEG
jgi:biopolymer transport protein ExbD